MPGHSRLLVAAIIALASAEASAQQAQVAFVLPEGSARVTEAPAVRSSNLISDGATRDLLNNGFPARLHYRVEQWTTGGWFDDIAATAEWDVVVRYDALSRLYEVYRVTGNQTVALGSYAGLRDADAAVGSPFATPISLPKPGRRTYYTLVLDIETLSLTELDEVERWLRGELKPAVRGKKNAGTAVSRGLRTLVVRLLGGEKRRYEARTATFRP